MAIRHVLSHFDPSARKRRSVLKKFEQKIGLVYFGTVDQHDDDHEAIRGFTASLDHQDTAYAVGTYEGYGIRIVQRSDSIKDHAGTVRMQHWIIFEISVALPNAPHVCFIPTGHQTTSFTPLFAAQPHLQPLNSLLSNRSPEFHGRYQIVARATHMHAIEEIFDSPLIVGIGARFWPKALELHNQKLYVYLQEKQCTAPQLESTLQSALWLAAHLAPLE